MRNGPSRTVIDPVDALAVTLALIFAIIIGCGAALGQDDKRPVASAAEVRDLEIAASKSRTARQALDKYDEFTAGRQIADKQQDIVAGRRKVWEERASQQRVRIGADWVTPAEAKAIGQRADKLISEVIAALKEGKTEYKKIKELLEKAAREDASGVRAYYFLAMLNTPNARNFAPDAERYFQSAVRRDPENTGLLNNLAISQVKMGRFSEALDSWAEALRSEQDLSDVIQNLGRFEEAVEGRRLLAGEAHRKRARVYLDKAAKEKKGKPFNPSRGWIYSKLVLSPDEKERSTLTDPKRNEGDNADDEAADSAGTNDGQPKAPTLLQVVGTGTGFVVADGILATNRHIALGGTAFTIVDRENPKKSRESPATLVAICKDFDLAILKCEAPKLPAIRLNGGPPRRGTEVMIFGFPLSNSLGESLKAVRGSVFGFADDKERAVLYDANTNPGNSGGPVCDRFGNVVAVHFAGLHLAGSKYDARFGMGIPVEKAIKFFKAHIPDLESRPSDQPLDWPEVDDLASRSTVLIKIHDEVFPIARHIPASMRAREANLFEDRTCVACKGRSVVPCPVKGCYRGSVSQFEDSFVVVNGIHGPIAVRTPTQKATACAGCGGNGIVSCPFCRTGLDETLGKK